MIVNNETDSLLDSEDDNSDFDKQVVNANADIENDCATEIEAVTTAPRECDTNVIQVTDAAQVITQSSDVHQRVVNMDYWCNLLKSCAYTLAHTMIASNLTLVLWYVFQEVPISNHHLHILLSVVGYQLLMAQAILSLSSHNSWSSSLRLLHRRRVHWMMQLLGSALAIAGSCIMMTEKTVHFNTLHGIFALIALVFTCASLVNGVGSLYASELRRHIPQRASRACHAAMGIIALTASSVALCFGLNKRSFKEWASDDIAYLMVGSTALYTLIVVAAPCVGLKRRIC